MSIQTSPVDRIGLLHASSIRSSLDKYSNRHTSYSYRSDTYPPSSSKSSSRKDMVAGDTIHYMSPATTPARTECEGDLYYQQFMDFPILPTTAPDYESTASTVSCEEPVLQRTLAIIKPEAVEFKDVVLRAVIEAGLKIINHRLLHLTPEQISEIYAEHYGSPAFPHMVVSMSISPLVVLSLCGLNAVDKWKTMIGPYGILREEWFFPFSVRTRFGMIDDIPDVLHASENVHVAKRETRYFYPTSILEPITIEEDRVIDYISLFVKSTLLSGLTELVRVKPIDPVLFLAEWLLLHNPYQPSFPEKVALSPL